MCRLRTADIRDGWNGDAQQPFAVANVVPRRAHHQQSFQRHVSAATSGATWPWQLQDGVAPVAKAATVNVNPDRNPMEDPCRNR